jgi:superkiller protein 3
MLKFNKFFLLTAIFLALFIQVSAQNQTAKDFFDQGINFLRTQKLAQALEAFQKSAELDPKQPTTQANIGAILIALNRVPDSIAPFREAVKLAPDQPALHTALCHSLSLTQNHTEAVQQCEEAVRLSGGNSLEAQIALIAALRTAKRYGEAAQKAEIALQKFPDDEFMLLATADAQADAENVARAVEIYESLARLRPGAAGYQIALAENYLRLERDAEALGAARKAIELEPNNPLAYFYSGKIYFELGQHDEAAGAFQKTVELAPQKTDALYYLGISENRRGKTVEAIAAMRKAVALAPQDFEYLRELGTMLNSDARYEEAIVPLKKAVALDPKNFETVTALGLALFEAAHYEEALSILQKADQMKPGNQIVLMFLSVTRARQQGVTQIDEMKRYAKENPDDLNVRMSLVQMLGFTQKIDEAESYIQEILQANPKDVRFYQSISAVYSTAGQNEKAAAVLRKSIAIDPNYPGPYLGLASIYAKNGKTVEAIAAYDKFLELKPDGAQTMQSYANFLRDNGKRREALEMYKRSLGFNSNNSPVIFNAGILSARLGDKAAALQYLAQLKTVDRQSAKTLERCLRLWNLL